MALLVPLARICMVQCRAFSVVSQTIWNDLTLRLCLLPKTNSSAFYFPLKAVPFSNAWAGSTSEYTYNSNVLWCTSLN